MIGDVLKLLSLAQTASGAKYYARGAIFLVGAFVVRLLWISDYTLARIAAFLIFDAALAFGLTYFLRDPLEWSKYLAIKGMFALFGLGRMVLKFALVGIAAVLSLIYFLSPIDIIPDVLIGLGWIDDALVAIGLISYAKNSEFSMPIPTMDADTAAEHPAAVYVLPLSIATVLTGLLRVYS